MDPNTLNLDPNNMNVTLKCLQVLEETSSVSGVRSRQAELLDSFQRFSSGESELSTLKILELMNWRLGTPDLSTWTYHEKIWHGSDMEKPCIII